MKTILIRPFAQSVWCSKKNIHPIERAVRVVAGAALACLAFWGPANKWFLLGLIPLATGLIGWVPALCAARHQHLLPE